MDLIQKSVSADPNRREKPALWRDLIAYWILGLCNNYGYVVMLSAAHDILQNNFENHNSTKDIAKGLSLNGTNGTIDETDLPRECNQMSTGAILLADIIPALLIKLVAPFLPRMTNTRMVVTIVTASAGYLLVAYGKKEWVAIAGVCFTSLSCGLGEVTLLRLSSHYNRNVISTWSSGTGGAGIFGAVSYAGLLQIGLTPETTLLVMLSIPALMAITFWIILSTPDYGGIPTKISVSTMQDFMLHQTLGDKIRNVVPLLLYMIPLTLVYLFEYYINQGMLELIQFSNTSLDFGAQYRWLQVTYQIGVFASRSSVNLIEIKQIWIMAVLQLCNVALFLCEAIFAFIPNFWIVMAVTLWEGLLGGSAYVNTFYRVSKEIPYERLEYSMGVVSMSDAFGITVSGIIAMPTHNAICKLPRPARLK